MGVSIYGDTPNHHPFWWEFPLQKPSSELGGTPIFRAGKPHRVNPPFVKAQLFLELPRALPQSRRTCSTSHSRIGRILHPARPRRLSSLWKSKISMENPIFSVGKTRAFSKFFLGCGILTRAWNPSFPTRLGSLINMGNGVYHLSNGVYFLLCCFTHIIENWPVETSVDTIFQVAMSEYRRENLFWWKSFENHVALWFQRTFTSPTIPAGGQNP